MPAVFDDGRLLSVVVASYTTERLADIGDLLASLESQVYEPLETVVVVEKSAELYDSLRRLANGNRRVVWNDGEGGLSSNRNLGLRESSGDYVAFVDDDVVLDRTWASQVARCFADESVGGVTGPAYPLWTAPGMDWLPEEFHWLVSCSSWADWREVREVRNAWGHNMAFEREAMEAAGPFSTELGLRDGKGPLAEDTEFSLRLRARTGKRIVFNPNAVTWHRVHPYRLSGRFIRERSFSMGRSRAMMAEFARGLEAGEALESEQRLLRRILTRLLPATLLGLARRPRASWRRLSLAMSSLAWLSMGYASGLAERRRSRS